MGVFGVTKEQVLTAVGAALDYLPDDEEALQKVDGYTLWQLRNIMTEAVERGWCIEDMSPQLRMGMLALLALEFPDVLSGGKPKRRLHLAS